MKPPCPSGHDECADAEKVIGVLGYMMAWRHGLRTIPAARRLRATLTEWIEGLLDSMPHLKDGLLDMESEKQAESPLRPNEHN